MQLLKVEPLQLQVFLSSAAQAFQASNARLIAPGKDQPALREKLDGVFRDLHATKGEAAALGMESLARRIHATEEILAALRAKAVLAGSDFVAVVTHLDELLRHVAELAGAQAQLAAYNGHGQHPVPAAAARPAQRAAEDAQLPQVSETPDTHPTERLLRSLAAEVGHAMGRDVQVSTVGLELVPAEHAARVKDICVQMVRNSIAHGIEAPATRSAAGKPPTGSIRISFTAGGRGDYALVIEDDGQGLSYDRILTRARQLSLVEPNQVALDRGAVFKMIFMPGFSTAGEVSAHAGRGVGLDAVNSLVRECGGRIGIATVSGQFTRFRVLLPGAMQAAAAAEA
jgi:chemotaxis protein histidine kinase CheA